MLCTGLASLRRTLTPGPSPASQERGAFLGAWSPSATAGTAVWGGTAARGATHPLADDGLRGQRRGVVGVGVTG
ncbi:MAG: hypothetical protein QOG89_3758, partial [Thermomicrobiales bacterium]|nr:hypothetical protein [Thermomicrobiales bacterium]